MATVHTEYLGDLRTRARHILSGETLTTDAPPDNQGKGEFFSPTDLLATALGSCLLTMVGIAARNHGFSIEGTVVSITKVMASEPRRVGEVRVEVNLPPNAYSAKVKLIIERTARTCPVALSLHPDLKQEIIFNYR